MNSSLFSSKYQNVSFNDSAVMLDNKIFKLKKDDVCAAKVQPLRLPQTVLSDFADFHSWNWACFLAVAVVATSAGFLIYDYKLQRTYWNKTDSV